MLYTITHLVKTASIKKSVKRDYYLELIQRKHAGNLQGLLCIQFILNETYINFYDLIANGTLFYEVEMLFNNNLFYGSIGKLVICFFLGGYYNSCKAIVVIT